MIKIIDCIAFIELQNKKVLVASSRGRNVWYIPGGKRDKGENDIQTLVREMKEELSIDLDLSSLQEYGVFEAQAHDQPQGVTVRMICYTGIYKGTIKKGREIDNISYVGYGEIEHPAPAVKLILEDLKQKKLIV